MEDCNFGSSSTTRLLACSSLSLLPEGATGGSHLGQARDGQREEALLGRLQLDGEGCQTLFDNSRSAKEKRGRGLSYWGPVDSGCHKLPENMWFVWFKTLYSVQKVGCHDRDRRTHGKVKMELESARQASQKLLCSFQQFQIKYSAKNVKDEGYDDLPPPPLSLI